MSNWVGNPIFIPEHAPLSNGPTYPGILGERFNLEVTPSKQGGFDFRYVTALTTGSFAFLSPKTPSFDDQTTQLLNYKVTHKEKIVFIDDPTPNLFSGFSAVDAAHDVVNIVNRLKKAGYKYIVVVNARDLFEIPGNPSLIPTSKDVYGALSLKYSSLIHALLDQIGFSVIQVDQFSLFKSIFAKPSEYGFSNVKATGNT